MLVFKLTNRKAALPQEIQNSKRKRDGGPCDSKASEGGNKLDQAESTAETMGANHVVDDQVRTLP